ncbi:hypothetical protein Gorai_013837, partial [Gossypium raimondii]|nr:hypothetical protein [Gossypium raimondii]
MVTLVIYGILQIWGTFIMQETYKGFDYLVAFLVA